MKRMAVKRACSLICYDRVKDMENDNQNQGHEEDPLTLAKLVSTWYAGAVVGFALGNLAGNLTTAAIGAVIGARVSWIFKRYLANKE